VIITLQVSLVIRVSDVCAPVSVGQRGECGITAVLYLLKTLCYCCCRSNEITIYNKILSNLSNTEIRKLGVNYQLFPVIVLIG